jgi:hypothetical protein
MKVANPLSALIIIAGISSVQSFLITYYDQESSQLFDIYFEFCFALFLAWWVQKDRFYKAKDAPYEYLAFIFFFWLVALPWYLIKTRGWKGILVFSGFLSLFWADYFSSWLAIYFWEFMNL